MKFNNVDELVDFLTEEVGYIFTQEGLFELYRDVKNQIAPLDYATGFIHGVVNTCDFDLKEISDKFCEKTGADLSLKTVYWKEYKHKT